MKRRGNRNLVSKPGRICSIILDSTRPSSAKKSEFQERQQIVYSAGEKALTTSAATRSGILLTENKVLLGLHFHFRTVCQLLDQQITKTCFPIDLLLLTIHLSEEGHATRSFRS